MSDLARSIRLAARGLARTPGFLAAAIAILGIWDACNADHDRSNSGSKA